MKTNLLAQNDNLVIENLKADVGKSVMDLSHSVTFPIDVDGAILPICCIETVPSDSFEISVECLLRQLSPLKVPVMTNLRLNTAFYYCDNRLAWNKWDRFMTGGRSGNEVYDIPRMGNVYSYDVEDDKPVNFRFDLLDDAVSYEPYSGISVQADISYKNALHTYLGCTLNHHGGIGATVEVDYSDDLPIAFPSFDYQMICRDFYTDIDRLPEDPKDGVYFYSYDDIESDWAYSNLFPSDENEIKLLDGANFKSGYHAENDLLAGNKIVGFMLDKVRYHNVRPDYFTTSKKSPMRGDAPALTVAAQSLKLPSGSQIIIKNNNGILHDNDGYATNLMLQPITGDGTPLRNLELSVGSDGQPSFNGSTSAADVGYPIEANSKANAKSINGYTQNDVSITGSLSTDFTAADIRLLSQLTVWQELNMLHEPYYNDFLNAHFDGVRVGESPVEKPQYIGGTSQLISINEILQTSQTSDTSPLGNQGATAMSLASNYVGRYYCNNYGYIIGVAYIVPDMLYKPAMPRGFSRRTKEDYYSPEFANLSMQATLNKEIFFSNDNDWNNQPWGYTGAFDELRSIPNRIAGDLLNQNYTDLQKWVLTRNFTNDNKPSMSSKFLSLKGNVDKTAWAVQTMPTFMLQCANYIKAVRPMPKIAIPKAL